MSTLRQRLAALTRAARFTRPEHEIAALSGLSRAQLYALRAKDHPHVSFATVYALARVFRCSLAWLGAGDGTPYRGVRSLRTPHARARVERAVNATRKERRP